jgi:two-component system, sensor histidine kinase and response regulator
MKIYFKLIIDEDGKIKLMNKHHVLIVDDNPANTLLLQRVLVSKYETHIVHDGHTALYAIKALRFDLVLLDIMMPDMTGIEVLQIIRQQYNSSELPVILISALTEQRDVVDGLRSGANDYIPKPIEFEIVLARVQTQITLKEMADERQFVLENLERANAMRNRLMRIASHDLKNPLNNLNMALGLIGDGRDKNGQILGMAQKSVKQMQGIIMEFLDMDLLKEDAIDIQLETVSIDAALCDALESFQYAASEKQIRLVYHAAEGHIVADPKRLGQVLNNLVSNAIKYSPLDSTVAISVEACGDRVRIHVVDSGAGIAKEEQSQLFKPFSNISTQPTAGESSTGLGLWIAQQMMHMQHGEIGLTSEAGQGCDFWIELPLADETAIVEKVG